jgi:hypothetical protein
MDNEINNKIIMIYRVQGVHLLMQARLIQLHACGIELKPPRPPSHLSPSWITVHV